MSTAQLAKDFVAGKDVETELLLAITEESNADYTERNAAFLTAHKLIEFGRCPYFAKLRYVDRVAPPVDIPNDNFLLGTGTEDAIVLSDEDFAEKYAVVKKRGTKDSDALEEAGKILLTEGMATTIKEARREFHESPQSPGVLTRRNIVAKFGGYCLKGELDHFDEVRGVPIDLKTCANINTFERDFHPGNDLFDQYAFQQAVYSFIWELTRPQNFDQAELFVIDKYDWSRSHKFILGYHTTLRPMYEKIETLIQQWKDCEESGIWPLPDLNTIEGRTIFRNSPYYLLPEMQQFKKLIHPSVF